MFAEFFASKEFADAMTILQNEFPLAIWETFYVTVVSTAIAIIIGLPLGVLLAVGGKDGILPLPRWLLTLLDVLINLLRSVPFLILMIYGDSADASDCRYTGRYRCVHRTAGHRGFPVYRKARGKLYPGSQSGCH